VATKHPFDAGTIGNRLLQMLEAANVDIAEYFACERLHHDEFLDAIITPFDYLYGYGFRHIDRRALKVRISKEGSYLMSWDWWIDPKEPAFLVSHEFRHFGEAENFRWNENRLPGWSFFWPFFYPHLTSCDEDYYCWGSKKIEESLKCLQTRYDRRWQKKMIKEAKINGTDGMPKIPGTWIE
jgi:hypothetical protein